MKYSQLISSISLKSFILGLSLLGFPDHSVAMNDGHSDFPEGFEAAPAQARQAPPTDDPDSDPGQSTTPDPIDPGKQEEEVEEGGMDEERLRLLEKAQILCAELHCEFPVNTLSDEDQETLARLREETRAFYQDIHCRSSVGDQETLAHFQEEVREFYTGYNAKLDFFALPNELHGVIASHIHSAQDYYALAGACTRSHFLYLDPLFIKAMVRKRLGEMMDMAELRVSKKVLPENRNDDFLLSFREYWLTLPTSEGLERHGCPTLLHYLVEMRKIEEHWGCIIL